MQTTNALKIELGQFKQNYFIDDVINFFALFNGTEDNSRKFELSQDIAKKAANIVFKDDNELFAELLQHKAAEAIELTPYQINRILLHAILAESWSEDFTRFFELILDFLSKLSSGNHQSINLQQTSYPVELINDLKMLAKYQAGEYLGNNDKHLGLLLQLLPINRQLLLIKKTPPTVNLFMRYCSSYRLMNKNVCLNKSAPMLTIFSKLLPIIKN